MASMGMKQESMKIQNRRAILNLLNNEGAMSRKDIARQVGLTPAAVTQLTGEMIGEGILAERGQLWEEETRAGRRKVLLGIEYGARLVLAVSIEMDGTTVSLCDLAGSVLTQERLATDAGCEPAEFLHRVGDIARALLERGNAKQVPLLGAGVTVTGIVNREAGVSVQSFGLWHQPVAVRALLMQELNCPVVLENNVRAFAEAELLFGLGRKGGNLLFLKWGPGVGSAVVIGGEVYQGRDRRAAEIGHYILEPDGLLCKCGKRGCLETRVSTKALHGEIFALLSREKTPALMDELEGDASRFTEGWFLSWISRRERGLFEGMDAAVRAALDRAAQRMALALVNAVTLLSPDRVVLLGSMLENPIMADSLSGLCARFDAALPPNHIVVSRLRDAFRHIGPAALIVRECFFDPAGDENREA